MIYINVTIKWPAAFNYSQDMRIPTNITVNKFLALLTEGLIQKNIKIKQKPVNVIKVATKHFVISNNDIISDFPIADGDILEIY
ncbi:MAG: hypothetical protein M3001_09570 [Staphylococcus epidermidis]|nr:hypothetical protein [Staphylococcus epidermidis]